LSPDDRGIYEHENQGIGDMETPETFSKNNWKEIIFTYIN